MDSKRGHEVLGRVMSQSIRQEMDLTRYVHNRFFSGIYGGVFFDPIGLMYEDNEVMRKRDELRPIFRRGYTDGCSGCKDSQLGLCEKCLEKEMKKKDE